jgi:hypothetical protein
MDFKSDNGNKVTLSDFSVLAVKGTYFYSLPRKKILPGQEIKIYPVGNFQRHAEWMLPCYLLPA